MNREARAKTLHDEIAQREKSLSQFETKELEALEHLKTTLDYRKKILAHLNKGNANYKQDEVLD